MLLPDIEDAGQGGDGKHRQHGDDEVAEYLLKSVDLGADRLELGIDLVVKLGADRLELGIDLVVKLGADRFELRNEFDDYLVRGKPEHLAVFIFHVRGVATWEDDVLFDNGVAALVRRARHRLAADDCRRINQYNGIGERRQERHFERQPVANPDRATDSDLR